MDPRTAVARVNGVAVTAGELETELERLAPSSVSAHGKTLERAKLRKKALDELIVRELAYQKAKQRGLALAPGQRNATVAKIKGHYKTAGGFREALKAEQISEQEFVRRVDKDLTLRKLYKVEVDDKSIVTPDEVTAYYRTHRAKFVVPESVRLLHILSRGNQQTARTKAEEALAKLKSGAPFFDVAYRYSDDDYRVVGGNYGWVHRGQLIPELETVAFSASPGALIGPIPTRFGWHILRIEERRKERQLPLAEVRDRIRETLHRERLTKRRADFTRRLRENARIEYLAP